MTVKKLPVMYKTSDGKEFDDQEQAEQHEALITAKLKYQDARRSYTRMLSESQQTADGIQFELTVFHTYYYITPGWYVMPDIKEVNFSLWNFDLSELDETVIVDIDPSTGKRTEYKIPELYYWRERAKVALIEAWKERLSDLQDDLAQMIKGE